MSKKFNSSEFIYDYLNGESKANITVSKLPSKIQRQLVTQAVQRITGGIQRNLNETQNTILDQELYGDYSPHDIVTSSLEEMHTLQINDLVFNVLPTQIAIQYQTHSFKSNTIRSQGPIKTKTGRGVIAIQLQLVFVGLSEINSQLRRLIAQARIFPIWYIDNEVIRSHVYPEDVSSSKNIGVVVTNLAITTHPEAVETLIATISLEVFNWEVYSRSFNFVGNDPLSFQQNKQTNFSNPTSKIGVNNPINSDVFKGYWNTILDGNKTLAINGALLPEELRAKIESINTQSPLQLYKTSDSYTFPEIKKADFESSVSMGIEYSSYKVIPQEVIKSLLIPETPDPSTKKNIKHELINQKRMDSELGIYSVNKLNIKDYEQISKNLTKFNKKADYSKNAVFTTTYKEVLEYAMKTSGFSKKPYYNDPNDRNRTDVFDCSSLVYNVLKRFGINIGTYTGSQLYNLRQLTSPVLTGSKEDLWYKDLFDVSEPFSLEGYLIYCFAPLPLNPAEVKELRKNGRVFTTSSNQDLKVGHVAFISKCDFEIEKKNNVSRPYRSLKFYHANSAGVTETKTGALSGYTYFEVYPIPGVSYSADQKVIPTRIKQEIKKVLNDPKIKQRLASDFSGLYAKKENVQKGEASILLYEASKAYGTRLVKALSKWLKKNKSWSLVWLRNGTFLLEKKNLLLLQDDIPYSNGGPEYISMNRYNSGPVLEHISISINNTFARIPMNGHELVTHQYLGGGDCDVIVHIKSIGLKAVQQLQMIRKYTEASSRSFRYLDDVGTFKITNPIIQLCGSEKFIIESMESKTNPNSPGLYDITLHLSEMRNNPRESESFKQEFVQTTEVRNKFIERLLGSKRLPLKLLYSEGIHAFLNYKFAQQTIDYNNSFSSITSFGAIQNNTVVSKDYGYNTGFGIPNVLSLENYANRLRDIENTFKDKQEFISAMIYGPAADMIGYAIPLFYILGITQDDLKAWTKDSKHPLYSFDLFNKINISTIIDPNSFVKPQELGFDVSIAGSKYNNDQIIPSKYLIAQAKRHASELFSELLLKKTFILKIPYKSSNFFVNAADWYANGWNSLQSFALGAGISLSEWFYGVDAQTLIGLNNFKLADELAGSQLAEANRIFKSLVFKKTSNILGDDVKAPITITLDSTSTRDLLDLQVKAKFILIALFSQFRSLVYKLGDIAINKLKYSDGYEDLVSLKNAEDFSLYGLPAYQDIPVPYIDFNKKGYSEVKKALAKQDMAPVQYLNPDFFFFNEGDHNELNMKRISEGVLNASRSMQANYFLSHQFGILPSSDFNQPKVGPAVAKGANTNNPAHEARSIDKRPASAIKANRLPDSLQNFYFPQIMGRSLSKGLAGFDGKTGTILGMAPYQNLSRNAITVDQLSKASKKGDLNQATFNPLNPALQTVSFGPYGGLESRLGVLLDRTPQSSLEFYTNSLVARNNSPYKIRRAMPSVKLYFIEDDTSGIGGTDPSSYVRSFDDFFSYKAIKEMKYVASRNFPAATLIIRLSNIYGNLDSLQFSDVSDASYDPVSKTTENTIEKIGYEKLNTPNENPFSRFMLKEGIRVQLRAGFENNPDRLPERFNGQIVQINQTAGDEVTIICQDFGTQLVSEVKGPDKTSIRSKWIDTFDMLSYLVCQPEMTYFGRWTLDVGRSVGESRSTGGWEKFFKFLTDPRDDNLFAPTREQMIHHFSDESGGLFSNMWWNVKRFLTGSDVESPNLSNNNVPTKISVKKIARISGRELLLVTGPFQTIGDKNGKIVNKKAMMPAVATAGTLVYEYKLADFAYRGLDYLIYRQTIWNVFKEMELRHPGWIGHPVPYGNRMTMFFGQPTQPYWYRPPNSIESAEIYKYNKILQKNINENKALKEINEQLKNKQGTFIANKIADTVKEYAWTVFDWASFAASLYWAGQTFGLGAGAGFAAKQGLKNILKGIAAGTAAGAISYLATNNGHNNFTSTVGALAIGLGTAFGAGRANTVFKSAADTAQTAISRFNIIRNIAGGAALIGLGAEVASIYYSNANMLLSLDTAIKQYISSTTLKNQIGGRLKSFRDYHIITSKNNIIANNIKSSVNNIYNAVTIEYVEDSTTQFDGNRNVFTANKATKVVRASHRILDKDIKMGFFSMPNCRGSWMADRYAQGLLMRYMKDSYQGEIQLIGDWEYKPYDRILVKDDFLGMYGQIEIEQVVHTLSPELGFISEVTPDMVIYGNQIVDMVYDNYMSAYLAWKDMSWTDAIDATLKNDPSKFIDNLKLRRDEAGTLLGRGAGTKTNPGGFTEVEARMLNSIPTLFALTLLGGGLGALTGGAAGGVGSAAATGLTGAASGSASVVAAGTIQQPQLITPTAARSSFANVATYINYKLFGSMALKFYEWSTSRQPLLFEPLFINGKPMLPTIDMDKVSMFQNINDQFVPVLGNLSRGFQVLQEAGRMFVYGELSDKLQNMDNPR